MICVIVLNYLFQNCFKIVGIVYVYNVHYYNIYYNFIIIYKLH